ncbi:hypothetical protein [Leptospira haakeii]|uniref:Lipoprotein n=1 Tax=Leptospira haakeii TaxID=2023198 RepID=A0ABX4PI80_9LEPT|nr:hypothetical protein [Leptospira haakeii]PKA14625.1 hypothetical protein CH363_17850 [Leptospira haakeii]PKA18737.1 hypothetical protein CH377_16385 [Leptospira haakeii]
MRRLVIVFVLTLVFLTCSKPVNQKEQCLMMTLLLQEVGSGNQEDLKQFALLCLVQPDPE